MQIVIEYHQESTFVPKLEYNFCVVQDHSVEQARAIRSLQSSCVSNLFALCLDFVFGRFKSSHHWIKLTSWTKLCFCHFVVSVFEFWASVWAVEYSPLVNWLNSPSNPGIGQLEYSQFTDGLYSTTRQKLRTQHKERLTERTNFVKTFVYHKEAH